MPARSVPAAAVPAAATAHQPGSTPRCTHLVSVAREQHDGRLQRAGAVGALQQVARSGEAGARAGAAPLPLTGRSSCSPAAQRLPSSNNSPPVLTCCLICGRLACETTSSAPSVFGRLTSTSAPSSSAGRLCESAISCNPLQRRSRPLQRASALRCWPPGAAERSRVPGCYAAQIVGAARGRHSQKGLLVRMLRRAVRRRAPMARQGHCSIRQPCWATACSCSIVVRYGLMQAYGNRRI